MVKHGLKRAGRGLRLFVRRLMRQTQGNVALMFAIALPILMMITLGAVDLHQASKVKAELQDALDAAALAAARSIYADDANINRVGMAALKANMPRYFQAGSADTANFVLSNNRVTGEARVNVKVLVANIFLPPYGKLLDDYLPVGSRSEVLRASRNVEVAMALDITGSMDNCTRNCPPTSKLQDLQAAAKDLIDIVVQDQQTPFYSKVALVPYAAGVNVGSLAAQARGPLDSTTRSVTAATWVSGTVRTISNISRASPTTITSNGHGFATGDRVVLWNVQDIPALNGVPYEVARISNNQFQLRTLSASGAASSYQGSSTSTSKSAYVAKCVRSDCGLTITAANHGLSVNDHVRLTSMGGLAQLNEAGFRVASVSGSQLVLNSTRSLGLVQASKGGVSYSGGGQLMNGRDGAEWRVFSTADGYINVLPSSTCVSERAGAERYTEARPSTAYVGRSYLDSSNACPSAAITPLTASATTLKTKIDQMRGGGSTAGQIGIAWAWYMLSPNFASLFDGAGKPGAYAPTETLKVAILMTDGEFNTPFRDGVIALDAGSGSGALNTHINLNSSNGDPFAQSVELCRAMHARGVVVYTVGFDLGSDTGRPNVIDSALDVMEACATNKNTHFFQANSGADLKEAFRAIGRDITRLRIAR
ncbi:TadE/TadG family type IV pilus assembly protein [Brevundimonas naejangsanensis]|uniref:TadE/TadG family type IV pilus assembly protein n=1 Tax=Brevundimonas naejangsanensis TaxID=588932 RepID=UPI000ECDD0EF|nr:TadE/TadG family type IV pilus assembly protein [Brevundimonas naejangsanensis]HCW49263.1 pilus assembly protein [Brevundimonas sp.]